MLYGQPPNSTTTKAASRPPALVLLTYRFIFCRVEPFHSLFRCLSLSLSPTTPPFLSLSLSLSLSRSLSLSLSQSLSLSPSPSLVVRIHPTAEWLLCLCACAHRGSLSIWTLPSPCYYSLNCPNSLHQHVCLHTRQPQVAYLLH